MDTNLSGKVCLVTGATRGLGKGIAVQLASCGAKCYVTGRNIDNLRALTEEVRNNGGIGLCLPVRCDHENDEEVKAVFHRIDEENSGRLDLLVNNAYSAVQYLLSNPTNFWEQPEDMWDVINNVGLRNHYLCSTYASRLMVKRSRGLIINISSVGGIRYLFSPPYGIGKAAKIRMARDCSIELRHHGVAFVSLLPGLVKTEIINDAIKEGHFVAQFGPYAEKLETPTYVGKTVVALLSESQTDIMLKTGKTLITTDIGRQYGITDECGNTPPAIFQLNFVLYTMGYHTLAKYIPNFIRIPLFLVMAVEMMNAC